MTEAETLLGQYGYLFVFLGSFLEGEAAVGLAGLAAHRGYLNLSLVIVTATLGSALGSQLWFHLGRWQGQSFLERRPQWQTDIQRFENLVARWQVPAILGFRFLYGTRIMGAAVLGVSRIGTWKFTLLNFAGAGLWAGLVSAGGYYLGKALGNFLGEVAAYEKWVILGIFLLAMGIGAWKFWGHRQMQSD